MYGLSDLHWPLLGLLAGLYLFTCVRVAHQARRIGRNPVAWFFITLFLTAIPATIIFVRDQSSAQRRSGGGGGCANDASGGQERAISRCPHCQYMISPAERDTSAGVTVCPRCELPIDNEELT